MESGSKKLMKGPVVLLQCAFVIFLTMAHICHARDRATERTAERDTEGRRVVYKQKNVVDFDAMLLEGDIRNPNEFYFVHRPEEKFGSLVKRRKNFHKEILRDSVMIR